VKGTSYSAGRPVKSSKETVTRGVDFLAPEAYEFLSNQGMMTVQQTPPFLIAQPLCKDLH